MNSYFYSMQQHFNSSSSHFWVVINVQKAILTATDPLSTSITVEGFLYSTTSQKSARGNVIGSGHVQGVKFVFLVCFHLPKILFTRCQMLKKSMWTFKPPPSSPIHKLDFKNCFTKLNFESCPRGPIPNPHPPCGLSWTN